MTANFSLERRTMLTGLTIGELLQGSRPMAVILTMIA